MVSFGVAVIGVAVLFLLVEARRSERLPSRDVAIRAVVTLLRLPRFRLLVAAGAALALATVADAFVYLALQHRVSFPPTFLPILYVGTSLVYLLLAIPVGRLADRVGRGRVLVGGLRGAGRGLPGASDAGRRGGAGAGQPAAVRDVLRVHGRRDVGPGQRRAARGAPQLRAGAARTGVAVAQLFSSLLFGGLWTFVGLQTAVVVYLAGLVLGMGLLAVGLVRTRAAA